MARHITQPRTVGQGRCGARPVAAVLAAFLLGGVGLAGATPVSAHSSLVGSTPADGARLDGAPSRVRLVFDKDIAARFATVTLTHGTRSVEMRTTVRGGLVVSTVPARLADQADPAGRWRVSYRVVSDDGHPIAGTMGFTVAPRTFASPRQEQETTRTSQPSSERRAEPLAVTAARQPPERSWHWVAPAAFAAFVLAVLGAAAHERAPRS